MAEIKARPTIYEGIQMRSRLEADYAAHLDSLGLPWAYEPKCFASQHGQWLPDFQTGGGNLPGEKPAYTEVKSAHLFSQRPTETVVATVHRIDEYLQKMTAAWATESDAFLELIFWRYQADEPVGEIFAHGDDHLWLFMGESLPFAMVWPGMEQGPAILSQRPAYEVP